MVKTALQAGKVLAEHTLKGLRREFEESWQVFLAELDAEIADAEETDPEGE